MGLSYLCLFRASAAQIQRGAWLNDMPRLGVEDLPHGRNDTGNEVVVELFRRQFTRRLNLRASYANDAPDAFLRCNNAAEAMAAGSESAPSVARASRRC